MRNPHCTATRGRASALGYALPALAAALMLAACGDGSAVSDSPTIAPFHGKDSPEMQRIGEEALAAWRAYEYARTALMRAAPGEYADHRQAQKAVKSAMPAYLSAVQLHAQAMREEAAWVQTEATAEEVESMGRAGQDTETALAEAAPDEWQEYAGEIDRLAVLEDLPGVIPAYDALVALQRAAPAEFRAYREGSPLRSRQIQAIRGGYRLHLCLSAYERARQALIEAAPEEFAGWNAAAKAMERYKNIRVFVPRPGSPD